MLKFLQKEFGLDNKNISPVQNILTIIFVCALLISNIISSRIFNFFGFSMTSAVMLFPVTYILSDVFSEVYGYQWSRRTCYIAFTCNLLMIIIFAIVSKFPVPNNDYYVTISTSFKLILNGSFACSVASIIAYVFGDFANDVIFAKMKKSHVEVTDHKGFGLRAILSSFVGEIVDSCIYLPLAFLVLNPIMTVKEVVTMICLQVILKTGYEAIILPLTTFIAHKVGNYETKHLIINKENMYERSVENS